MAHILSRPLRRLVRMTRIAGIRDLVFIGHHGRDEAEGMGVNKRVGRSFGFDRGHVASDALTACAALFVVRVLLDSCCPRAVRQ